MDVDLSDLMHAPTRREGYSSDQLRGLADKAAERHGIPKAWFRSLIGNGENGFSHPGAVSPAGARGVGQLMPATAEAEGVDPDDPAQNIEGSAAYAAEQWKKFKGDPKLAAAAYNAGPGNAEKHGHDLAAYPKPDETGPYVDRVTQGADNPDDIDLGDLMKPRGTPLQRARGANQTAQTAAHDARAHASSAQDHARKAQLYAQQLAQKAAWEKNQNNPANVGRNFLQDWKTRSYDAGTTFMRHLQQPVSASPIGQAGQLATDLLDEAAVPVMALSDTVLGRPVSNLTGGRVSPQAVTNAASLAVPLAGELRETNALRGFAREAGTTMENARANQVARSTASAIKPTNAMQASKADPRHYRSVRYLMEQGMRDFTPGQLKGGEAKVAEEKTKSSPYRGAAVREAEQRSLDDYIRGAYNKALTQIGERYEGSEVGPEGVKQVARKIGAVYNKYLPRITLKADQQIADDIKAIRFKYEGDGQTAGVLGPYKGSFDHILQTEVQSRVQDGQMSGQSWKDVESILTREANSYKSSRDPGARNLGFALEDLNRALRANVERSAPAGVREQIKRANSAWAIYKRIEAASIRRPKSMGRFTPADLLQETKKGATKGSFAHGEALMQDYATAGQEVLGDVVPDSGTAGRSAHNQRGIVGAVVGEQVGRVLGHGFPGSGMIGAAAGYVADRHVSGVTNALARNSLRREAQSLMTPHTRNFLTAAEKRSLAKKTALIPPLANTDQR